MAAHGDGSVWDAPKVYKHHEQKGVCYTRARYREGRRLKAVKVYTINLESRFLLVQGVPAIGVMTELVQLFALYGVIEEYRALDEYPAEQFTEVYLVKFQRLTSARAAKRNTDEKSFYGGQLHVCYAPEYETVEDTRLKLHDRRRYIVRATQKTAKDCDTRGEVDTSPATVNTPATAAPDEERERSARGGRAEEEVSRTSGYPGFPLLPLPPWEDSPNSRFDHSKICLRRHERTLPTEDKMGSLPHSHDYRKQSTLCVNQGPSGQREKEVNRTTMCPSPSVRFVPRTTHLECRKRKMDASEGSLLGAFEKNAPLQGPRLPEPPKLDMEDESLNITANLIRKTMTKVAVVPEKSTPSTKPRRRI